MRKILAILLLAAFSWCASVGAQRQLLNEELIRFHVVGASDSEADQTVKLKVRDAVITAVEETLSSLPDREAAEKWLAGQLTTLEEVANRVLEESGFEDRASISLTKEEFPKRIYDSFALPAGIYRSLRIRIGKAEGQNWWCVVFPSLCVGAASDFEETAACAGFSKELTATLEGKCGYELRFFALDALGRLENLLRRG